MSNKLFAALPLSFALTATSLAQPVVGIFDGVGLPAWSRYSQFIESRFGKVADRDQVLVLPTPTEASWDDKEKAFRLMEMHRWGDSIPANAWQYAAIPNKRVSDGYRDFLNRAWIAAVNKLGSLSPDSQTAMKRANDAVETARNEYNKSQDRADQAYAAYVETRPPGQRKSKETYFKDQGYNIQIIVAQKKFTETLENFTVTADSIKDNPDIELLKRAKIRFNNETQTYFGPISREDLNNSKRWERKYYTTIDGNLPTFLSGPPRATIESISESYESSRHFEQLWKAGVKVKFLGLIKVGGLSAEEVKIEKALQKAITRIDIAFDNLDMFNIVRGQWYDEAIVNRFASVLPPAEHAAVFGKNGSLELIPRILLVAKGLRFRLYADSATMESFYKYFQGDAEVGFSIGYFTVGVKGRGSVTRTKMTGKKANDYLEFYDTSGRGQVLALLATQLGAPRAAIATVTSQSRDAARQTITDIFSADNPANVLSREALEGASASRF